MRAGLCRLGVPRPGAPPRAEEAAWLLQARQDSAQDERGLAAAGRPHHGDESLAAKLLQDTSDVGLVAEELDGADEGQLQLLVVPGAWPGGAEEDGGGLAVVQRLLQHGL